jgi:NAD(P)-dependent dehydrogenase (short-subunit alcohol dehydrogenase family)
VEGERRQVVLVTGAAGSIGRETLRLFAPRFHLATADRKRLPEPDDALVGRQLIVDLGDDDAVREAFAQVPSLGPLQHVIAIAGGGDIEELTDPDPATEDTAVFTRVISENLVTAFVTIRHALPLLRAGDGDRSIALLSSINAFGGYGAPAYSAAKAGLIGLANALATPLGHDGIRINSLALGTVDTDHLRELSKARGVEPDLDRVASRNPLGRVLTPDEVAKALAATVDMPGLTGATIVLDNGQTHIR